MHKDAVFGVSLFVSFVTGPLLRYAKSPLQKQWLSSLAGVALMIFACGVRALHPIVVTLGNCLIIFVLGPRRCHVVSFVWCFGYLLFFYTSPLFGFTEPDAIARYLQMFNALKMTGVAFEIHDASFLKRKPSETDDDFFLRQKYEIRPSSSLDIIHYSLCYVGLFTGPYYKFRTYRDMLNLPSGANIPVYKSAIVRIKQLPAIAIVYLICTYFVSVEYAVSAEFPSNPFWFRLVYAIPMFMIYRTRLYLAWMTSEVICMTSGLGAYPTAVKANCGEGPSDLRQLEACKKRDTKELDYDFETIRIVDPWGFETVPSVQGGIRIWNMCVQYWLAAFVYRRMPRSLDRTLRVIVTFGVSAFWHGIHPGNSIGLLTFPFLIVAEDLMTSSFRRGSDSSHNIFDWLCWFCKMRAFEYISMGFLLQTFDRSVAYWRSVYFIWHIVVASFIIIGLIFKPRNLNKKD